VASARRGGHGFDEGRTIMRSRVRHVAPAVVFALALVACGDGRKAELQIVVHAREIPVFGGRVQGILLGGQAVAWTLDLVEVGGRPCRLTGLVIVVHRPDRDDYARSYNAAELLVSPEIPAYGTLHLRHNFWLSVENYFPPPRISLANTLVLDVAAHFRDGGEERIAAVTFGPSMPME
jgi:hypothetical protein